MNFATYARWTIPEGNVVQIADASGRVIWSADKTPPTLTVDTLPSSTKASSITVSGTAIDASGIDSVTVTVGSTKYNTSVNSNGSWSVSVSLADGNNSISVVAKDKMGNTTSSPSYTVRRLVFVTVYDWGSFSTNTTEDGYPTYEIGATSGSLPSGFGTCNVLIYDGVEYDVSYSADESAGWIISIYSLKPVSGGAPFVTLKTGFNQIITLIGCTNAGAHSVKIGYYQ